METNSFENIDLYLEAYQEKLKTYAHELDRSNVKMNWAAYNLCKVEAKRYASELCPEIEKAMAENFTTTGNIIGSRILGLSLKDWFNKEFSVQDKYGVPIKEDNDIGNDDITFAQKYENWLSKNDYVSSDREVAYWLGCTSAAISYARKKVERKGFEFENKNNRFFVLKRPEPEKKISLTENELNSIVQSAISKALQQSGNR